MRPMEPSVVMDLLEHLFTQTTTFLTMFDIVIDGSPLRITSRGWIILKDYDSQSPQNFMLDHTTNFVLPKKKTGKQASTVPVIMQQILISLAERDQLLHNRFSKSIIPMRDWLTNP